MRATLLVAHGTVEDIADIPAFLKNVRRGRDASPELVREMTHRYRAIGKSPLLDITRSVAKKLEARTKIPTRVAMRLWKPTIADVLSEIDADEITVLSLAQHSAHVYEAAVKRDAGTKKIRGVGNWGSHPKLLDAFAKRIRAIMTPESLLVLTAHSLPTSVIASGDPYEKEFLASVEGIRARVGKATYAFQSQGADGGDWLGPTLQETIANANERRVVVAPIGFLADHLEILYDIDIEARALAKERGIELLRTQSLNDDEDFIDVLEELVR